MSSSYLLLIVASLAIGGVASGFVRSKLKKYSHIASSSGLTGAQYAEQMLNYYGVHGVPVRPGGPDQDFFDPRSNSVTLSPEVFNGRTVTAMAVAAHEVGHACQYAQGYTPMKIRGSMFPVVQLASNLWLFVLIAGVAMQLAGLVEIAILMYVCVLAFELITLPVEFNASRRGMQYLELAGVPSQERSGARSVLTACALTYVAAALVSVLQLLWILGQRD